MAGLIKKEFIVSFFLLGLLLFVTACELQGMPTGNVALEKSQSIPTGNVVLEQSKDTPIGKAPSPEDRVVVTSEKFGVLVSIVDALPKVPEIVSIEITTINPSNPLNSLGLSNNVAVTFDEALDPATVNQDTFIIKDEDDVKINGEITSDETKKIWVFNITENLKSDSVYTVTITRDVKGISGNPLNKTFIWKFTKNPTENSSVSSRGPVSVPSNVTEVDLGTITGMLTLSKSGISTDGMSLITG